MKRLLFSLTSIVFAGALVAAPAPLFAQQPPKPAEEHAAHHPETPPPANIDALIAKMNAAKGSAKVDAMAEVITALAAEHKACEPMMAEMKAKMEKMEKMGKGQ